MKQPPAGDFSDILAGLTEDGGPAAPKTAPRAGRPAAPARKANVASARPVPSRTNPPARKDDALFDEVLKDRILKDKALGEKDLEEKDPGPASDGERPQAGVRRLLRRLFPAIGWRKALQLLLWRAPQPAPKEKLKPEPAAKPAADAAPARRPTSRIRNLFRAMPWPMQKPEPTSKPGSGSAGRKDARAPDFRLPRTEDEAIAAELGLRADLASGDLRKIRREFAMKNHPDRIAAPQRMSAARRMSIANMLIDEHLKKQQNSR